MGQLESNKMPKYHCLDTEVQLFVSELKFHHAISVLSDPAKQSPGRKHYVTTVDSNVREDTSAFNRHHRISRPFRRIRLTEQRFKGFECLDFLGLETPFFLICAGKGASDVTLSPLSFQSPKILSSPHALNFRSQGPDANINEHASAETTTNVISQKVSNLTSSAKLLKVPRRLAENIRTPSENPKFDVLSKPIEVVIKLSESSFISPNFATESSPYDICINIFYNGEFSASHVIKYSTLSLNGGKMCVRLGGRRFAADRELPWKIDIKSESACSSLNSSSKDLPVLTPEERWGELMTALNTEANEWGRDERGNRSPTGKYLELISMMTIPTELRRPLVGSGYGFGVIDVVITLGRFSYIDVLKDVASPIRYLHTSQCQMAEIPSDQKRRHKIAIAAAASITGFSSVRQPRSSNAASWPAETRPEAIYRSPIIDENHNTVSVQSDHRGQNFSNSPDTLALSLDLMPQRSIIRDLLNHTTPMNSNIPSGEAEAFPTRPPHPHRPEKVPQKRYRGTEPEAPILPPPKRRGKAKAFGELPIDLAAATYMSTRAKRNASISFATTPSNEGELPSIMRENSFHISQSLSGKPESLETKSAKPPLTPKNKASKNTQTQVLGGHLKKKARSSNYNPKLSNRPQNLRRKNSAGEWVIPPCRKNSSGEWETPTKRGQTKDSGSEKSSKSKPLLVGNEKIFQPVFDISTSSDSRDMEIQPRSASKVSSSAQKRAMNGKTSPAKVSEQPRKSLLPAMISDIKEEHMVKSNEAGYSAGIVNQAGATHVMNLNSKLMVKRVNDKPENNLVETSPSRATKAFDTYLIRRNEEDTINESNDSLKKKSLRMRFFQGGTSYGEGMVDRGHSTRRWLVERCISSGYTLGKGITETFVPQSPSRRKPDRALGLTSVPRVEEKFIDVIKDPAPRDTTKLHSQFATKESGGQATTSRQCDITASSQDLRNLDTNQQQFVAPNRNATTIKLVRRRGIATIGAEINYDAQASIGQAPPSYRPDNVVLSINGGKKEDGSPPTSEIYENFSKPAHQDLDLSGSVTALSVEDTFTMFTGPPAIVKKQPGPEIAKDMDVHSLWEDRTRRKTPAGTINTERLFRPKTVGSTELKALLESHDRHSIIDNAPGTPLAMIESQFMTRSSRKAVSSTPHKDIAQSRDSTNKKSPRDPVLAKYNTNKGLARVRSSSGKFVRKLPITTPAQKRIASADISGPRIVTTRAEGNTGLGNVIDDIQNSVMRNLTLEEAETRSGTGKGYDLSANVGGSKVVAQPTRDALRLDEAAEEVDVALKQVLMAKTEINKAARDFECLKSQTSAPRKLSAVDTEAQRKGIPDTPEHGRHASTLFTRDATDWKPSCLCQNSILTYAGAENWPGTDLDPATGQVFRRIEKQEIGHFKASSILMGVRYVVVGSGGFEAVIED